MKTFWSGGALYVMLFFLAYNTFTQTISQSTTWVTVSEVVSKSALETERYVTLFRNLVARETKTIRLFDKNEKEKRSRAIVSNFMVYQLSKDANEITEFRSVLTVDGKPVGDIEKRTSDLLEQIKKAETSAKELERIQKESLRYDDEIKIVGMTLFQAIPLNENIRRSLTFELAGKETMGGRELYVVRYKQNEPSRFVRLNQKEKNDEKGVLDYECDLQGLKNVNERISGILWIDTATFQIVRESRELTIQPERFETRIPIAKNEFEYIKSEFGILTPRRISHVQYRIDKKGRRSIKDVEVLFEYSDFVKPDVEVKISEN